MRHLDLFSGIGGFALAASWVWPDHEIHSFVEIDSFCVKVLNKHWPNVPVCNNIREYEHDGTKIDLLTGGFPCQPFSVAGQRRGKEDDRFLWPEMFRIIQEARPTWIVGENVAGIISMVEFGDFVDVESQKGFFSQERVVVKREGPNILFGSGGIVDSLENEGYEVQTFVIPACAIGAPHRRDRVWIIANSNSPGLLCRKDETWNNKCYYHVKSIYEIYKINETYARNERNNDGVSDRMDRLKSLGNAIVPQVAAEIFRGIKEISE